MPAMESDTGIWLFDTTPMIAWLEKQYGGVSVLPDDPALAFITLLWDACVNKKNENKVRDMLFRGFEFLEPLLEEQPYIMGSHPSMADYDYFASMFRHFGNDPDSAEIMRMQAPNTYEWLARL